MNDQREKCVRTADVIATYRGKYVLIERLKYPHGFALPGGHIDPGEKPRQAAIREFFEETGLLIHDARFVTRRRGKNRDPRYAMSETNIYAGTASGDPKNERGFTKVIFLSKKEILALSPKRFAFDHWKILVQHFGR